MLDRYYEDQLIASFFEEQLYYWNLEINPRYIPGHGEDWHDFRIKPEILFNILQKHLVHNNLFVQLPKSFSEFSKEKSKFGSDVFVCKDQSPAYKSIISIDHFGYLSIGWRELATSQLDVHEIIKSVSNCVMFAKEYLKEEFFVTETPQVKIELYAKAEIPIVLSDLGIENLILDEMNEFRLFAGHHSDREYVLENWKLLQWDFIRDMLNRLDFKQTYNWYPDFKDDPTLKTTTYLAQLAYLIEENIQSKK